MTVKVWIAVLVGMVMLAAVGCMPPDDKPTSNPGPTEPILMTIDCNNAVFTQEIITMSEKNAATLSHTLLKIYDGATVIERTPETLRCRREARRTQGPDLYIIYYMEIDREGDLFVGYKIEN